MVLLHLGSSYPTQCLGTFDPPQARYQITSYSTRGKSGSPARRLVRRSHGGRPRRVKNSRRA
jgi:hypothetical protein